MPPFCDFRRDLGIGRSAIGGLTALILMSLASTASARAIPLTPVHLPPVTLHSMNALQSEIVDARTKPQRDRDRQHPQQGGAVDGRH